MPAGEVGPWFWGLTENVSSVLTTNSLREVRRLWELLAQAEYAMVKQARRSGLSWTDIGIPLGMTRQSAWERWHQDGEVAEAS